ncbi:MAG: hypothetical protein K5945_09760 [Bacteroidaceae bacterium]|nr:hypothetical protein [Bacteroidaceae bacterium]
MPKDSAILLNLTSRLTFEDTDPLMSVVVGDGALLFYDRLSVAKFPSDATNVESHVAQLLSAMYNLLSARTLSDEDHNERIRLIVTLDMIGGAFQPQKPAQKCFPAQKARQFRKIVADTVGRDNPLLRRFDYCFLFLSDRSAAPDTTEFYLTLADDGLTGLDAASWIDHDSIQLNRLRDDTIRRMNTPDDQWPLTSSSTALHYQHFLAELCDRLKTVTARMKEAAVGEAFETLFAKRTKDIASVEDFRTFDYDEALSSSVGELLGLCASDFRNNTAFFFIDTDDSNARKRTKSATFVAALVQFLTTMGPDDYRKCLLTPGMDLPARIFSARPLDYDNIDGSAIASLQRMVESCLSILDGARWKKDLRVRLRQYTARSQDVNATDSYNTVNDKKAKERQLLFDRFFSARSVPFFFGKRVGEWKWFRDVAKTADDLYRFESLNSHPLYDMPHRIGDNEMEDKEVECDYAELQDRIAQLKKEDSETTMIQDLNTYLRERQVLMEKFGSAVAEMKKEMVRLGYLACLFWLGMFCSVVVTLSYAFHFFQPGIAAPLWLVAVAFAASVVLFALAAVGAQASVKRRLKATHLEMDTHYHQMQANLQAYLDGVNARAKLQNEADIRRKNIDEMEAKLLAFTNHNKQVDLWVAHYRGIAQKLSFLAQFIDSQTSGNTEVKVSIDDFNFESAFPSLPYVVCHSFANNPTEFSTQQIKVNGATSFVRLFRFAEQQR